MSSTVVRCNESSRVAKLLYWHLSAHSIFLYMSKFSYGLLINAIAVTFSRWTSDGLGAFRLFS